MFKKIIGAVGCLCLVAQFSFGQCMTIAGNLDGTTATPGTMTATLDEADWDCGTFNAAVALAVTGSADMSVNAVTLSVTGDFDDTDIAAGPAGTDFTFLTAASVTGPLDFTYPTVAGSSALQDLVFSESIVGGNSVVVNVVDPCGPDLVNPTVSYVASTSVTLDGTRSCSRVS